MYYKEEEYLLLRNILILQNIKYFIHYSRQVENMITIWSVVWWCGGHSFDQFNSSSGRTKIKKAIIHLFLRQTIRFYPKNSFG